MIRLIKTTTILAAYLVCTTMAAQDVRTLETRIADLLVQMPASDLEYRDRLAEETYNLGNEGQTKICSMVVPPGTGDDSGARLAIESLSKYLTREKPSERTMKWETVCIGFATRESNRDVQEFFMRQLQWIGSTASIDALAPFLSDEILCNPAVAAMKYADPEKAGKLLASELSSLSGAPEIVTVKALGELKVTSANAVLLELLTGQNETDLQRNILRSLALIGSPDSHKPLLDAAKGSGFKPEATGATASLLEYAKTLGENGNAELSKKICLDLIKKCKDSSQIHFKSSAIIIYTDIAGMSNATPVLVKAMKDPNKAYRMSIMQYAMCNPGPVEPWVKLLGSSKDPEVQAEIINLLASRKEKSTLGTIRGFIDNPDTGVRCEALNALASMEGSDAVDVIITYMFNHSSEADLKAAKSALLLTATPAELLPFVDRIDKAPDPVKIVLLEVFAEKGSPEFFQVLVGHTNNGNEDVSHAAFRGLKKVATGENLETLIDLLDEDHDAIATDEIQQAVVSAVNSSKDKSVNTDLVLSGMEKAEEEIVYIPVLAGIGGVEGLNSVKRIYDNSQGETRKLALEALVDWSDDTAIPVLFDICKESGSEYALSGYVFQVNRSNHTPDQKLLLLRKIMPLASDTGQKSEIIKACSGIKTFQSFMFISGFMEKGGLQQASASAAIQVALPSPGKEDGLYGDNVRSVLAQAKEIISGPESPYVKIDVETYLKTMSDEQGFVPLFNGTDLSGWQGLVEDPIARAKMSKKVLEKKQAEADEFMNECWTAHNGILMFNGKGHNICTIKDYKDFEMIVDWRINKEGDSGIYLRGSPQVQIWDTSRVESGAQVGSGGLYNNQKNPSKPLQVADNIIPDWNTFHITMIGEKVTVYLNGILVVDNVVMENYWDRSIPIFPEGPIELQAHGNDIAFRDVFVREIQGVELSPEEKEEGFVLLFNGKNLDGWIGNKTNHVVENGEIAIRPELGGHGNLYTAKEYANFNLRIEFKLTPGANNGLGIRTPPEGDAAYVGMEFQVLDNTAPVYANLEPYQYHGSVYGVIPARRGFLKPVGEWNEQEVIVDGTRIKIILNGTVIVDGDIADSIKNGTLDGKDHPGLKRKTGHIGFLGHGSELWYRNIRIKELD